MYLKIILSGSKQVISKNTSQCPFPHAPQRETTPPDYSSELRSDFSSFIADTLSF